MFRGSTKCYKSRFPHISKLSTPRPFILSTIKMQYLKALLFALAAAPAAIATPTFGPGKPKPVPAKSDNPFVGVNLYANSRYAKKLETTIKYFLKKGDVVNALRTRTVQKIPSFFWISNTRDVSILPNSILIVTVLTSP